MIISMWGEVWQHYYRTTDTAGNGSSHYYRAVLETGPNLYKNNKATKKEFEFFTTGWARRMHGL